MTILVGKYVQFMNLNSSVISRLEISSILPFFGLDLKDVQAISGNNLVRTLLDYEETVFKVLSEKSCNKTLHDRYMAKSRGRQEQRSVSDFLFMFYDDHQQHLIQMMHQYAETHKKDEKYQIIFLEDVYSLIKETNQLMRAFEKLASLTKAGGWFIFISGIVNFDNFKIVLKNYFDRCSKFIETFSNNKEIKNAKFNVLRSAMIKYNVLNLFNLTHESSDLFEHLDKVTNPRLLEQLTQYFSAEIDELKILQTLLNCKIVDEKKLQAFTQLASNSQTHFIAASPQNVIDDQEDTQLRPVKSNQALPREREPKHKSELTEPKTKPISVPKAHKDRKDKHKKSSRSFFAKKSTLKTLEKTAGNASFELSSVFETESEKNSFSENSVSSMSITPSKSPVIGNELAALKSSYAKKVIFFKDNLKELTWKQSLIIE